MKTAALISIGTEIMKGRIDDTNSTFISKWLYEKNIIVRWRLSVEDIIEDIEKALDFVKDSDVVILTGGLGPTDDDLTREAISSYLHKQLIFNDDKWNEVAGFFKKRNLSIAESNKKQAMLITDGFFITNEIGTAPGMYYIDKNKIYFLFPGPPVENQFMINNHLFNILKQNNFIEGDIYSQIIRIYNSGESEIADIIKPLDLKCDVGYYFTKEGWVEIHLTKRSNDKDNNKKEVSKEMKIVINHLKKNNKYITEDDDLSRLLLDKLVKKKLTLSFAESITGGYLSSEFVKNSGASKVFKGSIVSYSNELKIKLLNVKKITLDKYGAVSEETALEMAKGLKKNTNADVCVSITGIAGPSGGTKDKPVGLVYMGFIINDTVFAKKEIFFGSRDRIIHRCINFMLIEILKNL